MHILHLHPVPVAEDLGHILSQITGHLVHGEKGHIQDRQKDHIVNQDLDHHTSQRITQIDIPLRSLKNIRRRNIGQGHILDQDLHKAKLLLMLPWGYHTSR